MIKITKLGMEPDTFREYVVTPTMFPDKTSQIWKLPEEALYFTEFTQITWEFENEAELIHVLQLATLINSRMQEEVDLYLPYLPYARQDKPVDNHSTFALTVFLDVLEKSQLFGRIQTVDAHNPKAIGRIYSNPVTGAIAQIIMDEEINMVCFPDKGASQRGYGEYRASVILDKKRNQLTGEIEGLKLFDESDAPNVKGKTVLIVDDLTDGGRTFIEASKLLYSLEVKNVILYTTHGIYSKGTKVIFDSGISKIFNINGEVLVRS